MYSATVTSKRQITIPAKLFRELGLKVGDVLNITKTDDDKLQLQNQIDLINNLAGSVQVPEKYKGLSIEELKQKTIQDYFKENAK